MVILIVDEYRIARFGLKRIIENIHPEKSTIYEASSFEEIHSLLLAQEINAIFIEASLLIKLNDRLAKILPPQCNIAMVATHVVNDSVGIQTLFKSSIKYFIYRDDSADHVAAVYNELLKENEDPNVTKTYGEDKSEEIERSFSKREMEVLQLLCMGLSNKDIAQKLFISNKTVEWHKSSLIRKSSAKNINTVIIRAYKAKLFENLQESFLS